MKSITLLIEHLFILCYIRSNEAFTIHRFPESQVRTTSFLGQQFKLTERRRHVNTKGSTKLGMYLGSDGGILGVGAPEVAVIVLAGYFLLGPTELFKLTKQIGKLFTSLRTISTDVSKNFESTMEDQLQLQEIRKAQRELTDAFSFRRSIYTSEDDEPFADKPAAEDVGLVEGKKKVRRRRKVVKKPVEASGAVEDLVMPLETSKIQSQNLDTSSANWFEDPTQPNLQQQTNRFQQQLSSQWNDTILQNSDKLSPLSTIMERLALLEQERAATERRLEEEFREKMEILEEERTKKTDMEEEFYQKKRRLLEEAALEVQTNVFSNVTNNSEATAEKK